MANWRDEVLLEADFSIPPKRRVLYKVTLIPRAIFYSPISSNRSQYHEYEEKSVQLSDVIGCHCSSLVSGSNTRSDNNTTTLTVFAYPFRTKLFSGKKTRHRLSVTFEVNSCATFEENVRLATRWKNVINCLSRGIHISPGDVELCEPPRWGRFLILVNPHSGPGRALQIFKSEVEPMLEEAGIPLKLVITEYAGHAHDLMQTLELDQWAAVVIVSGDGLVYEVINGLMQRVDWTSAIKTPIGYLPGGSGNALGCSINYAAGEPVLLNPVLHSTFVLIKHRVLPMDLVLVQTPSSQCFSFLSLTWGIIADIDYESEKYRNLGEARFTLGAIKRIVNLRAYSGRLSFLPVAEYTPKSMSAPKRLTKVRRFSLRSLSSSLGSVDSLDSRPSRSSSVLLTGARSLASTPPSNDKPRSFSHSGFSNGVGGGVGDGPPRTISEHSGSETDTLSSPAKLSPGKENGEKDRGDGLKEAPSPSPAVMEVSSSTEINANTTTTAATLNTNGLSSGSNTPPSTSSAKLSDFEEETVYGDKKKGGGVPAPFLPPLDQPVPDNWVVIEDRFVLACAIYQTHLGSDMLAAPSARLADGVIHLMFVRDGVSRNQLLNHFLSFSEGTHVDSPDVEFVPVLAFRLEPAQNSGNIMIDGERLDPVVPVQGQVLPGLARVMAIQ